MKKSSIIALIFTALFIFFGVAFLTFSQSDKAAEDYFPRPVKVAVDEETNIAFVLSELDSSLAVFDANRSLYLRSMTLPGANPRDLAINQTTKKVFISTLEGRVFFIDGKKLIENPTGDFNPVLATISLTPGISFMAVNEKTNRVFVGNAMENYVAIIDGDNNSEIKRIQVGKGPYAVTLDQQADRTYVLNFFDNSISIIDGKDDSVRNLTFDFPIFDIKLNSSTGKIYASSTLGEKIYVIDQKTEKVVSEIAVAKVGYLEVNSKTNKIYAIGYGKDGKTYALVIIDGRTNKVVDSLNMPKGFCPVKLAFCIKTNKLYIPDLYNANVAVFDTITDKIEKNIPTGANPQEVVINETQNKVLILSPEGHNITVSDENTDVVKSFPELKERTDFFSTGEVFGGPSKLLMMPDSGNLLVLNRTNKRLQVVDTKTNKVKETFAVGNNPRKVYYDQSSKQIFVTNGNDDTVTVIDSKTTKTSIIKVGQKPRTILPIVGDDGGVKKLYIVNFVGDTISVLNVKSLEIDKTIEVGRGPAPAVFDRETGLAYVVNMGGDEISVIDARKDEVVKTLELKINLGTAIAKSEEGAVYVSGQDGFFSIDGGELKLIRKLDNNAPIVNILPYKDKVYLAELLLNTVEILQEGTNEKIADIYTGEVFFDSRIGYGPEKMVVNKKYNKLYVLSPSSSSVSIIDLNTNKFLVAMSLGVQFKGLREMFYDESKEKLYVAAHDTNNLAVISGKTNEFLTSIPEIAGLGGDTGKKLYQKVLLIIIIISIVAIGAFLLLRKK